MSLGRKRGEGIGGTFYEKYKSDFFPSDECPVPGRGVYKKVPRYYETLYAEEDPETYATIKAKREIYRDQHKDNYTTERLKAQETVKKKQLQQLKRT